MRTCLLLVLVILSGSCLAQTDETASGQTVRISDRIDFTAITYDDGVGGFLMSPSSVFYDAAAGEVFVTAAGNHRVVVYDTGLTVKYSFVHYVSDITSGRAVPGEPRAIVVTRSGDMLVADNLAEYVDVLDFRGTPFFRLYPNRILGDTTLSVKANILALDEAGNIYMATSGDKETILMLDSNFQLIRTIGKNGAQIENLNNLVSVAVSNGRIYTADLYAIPTIKIYDTLGVYQSGFGGHEIEKTDFSYVSGITVTTDSTGAPLLWISDALRQVVKVFSDNGQFLSDIGGYGRGIGEFQYPSGLVGGSNRTFFVVEKVTGRVQKFEMH